MPAAVPMSHQSLKCLTGHLKLLLRGRLLGLQACRAEELSEDDTPDITTVSISKLLVVIHKLKFWTSCWALLLVVLVQASYITSCSRSAKL